MNSNIQIHLGQYEYTFNYENIKVDHITLMPYIVYWMSRQLFRSALGQMILLLWPLFVDGWFGSSAITFVPLNILFLFISLRHCKGSSKLNLFQTKYAFQITIFFYPFCHRARRKGYVTIDANNNISWYSVTNIKYTPYIANHIFKAKWIHISRLIISALWQNYIN